MTCNHFVVLKFDLLIQWCLIPITLMQDVLYDIRIVMHLSPEISSGAQKYSSLDEILYNVPFDSTTSTLVGTGMRLKECCLMRFTRVVNVGDDIIHKTTQALPLIA